MPLQVLAVVTIQCTLPEVVYPGLLRNYSLGPYPNPWSQRIRKEELYKFVEIKKVEEHRDNLQALYDEDKSSIFISTVQVSVVSMW